MWTNTGTTCLASTTCQVMPGTTWHDILYQKYPRDLCKNTSCDVRTGIKIDVAGSRRSGVRVVIPPQSAEQPLRLTVRQLRPDQVLHLPPLSDGEEQAGDDYPLPPDHWLNSPLGRDGDYKTFLHLALEAGNNDAGQDIFHWHEKMWSRYWCKIINYIIQSNTALIRLKIRMDKVWVYILLGLSLNYSNTINTLTIEMLFYLLLNERQTRLSVHCFSLQVSLEQRSNWVNVWQLYFDMTTQ